MLRTGDFGKLGKAPLSDGWLLFKAGMTFTAMRLVLKYVPPNTYRDWLQVRQQRNLNPAPSNCPPEVLKLGWAVNIAGSRLMAKDSCMVRAYTAAWMLRRRGISSSIYSGVAKDITVPKQLLIHAWLKVGSEIVTGNAARVAQYIPMSAYTLAIAGQAPEAPAAVTEGSGANAMAGLFKLD